MTAKISAFALIFCGYHYTGEKITVFNILITAILIIVDRMSKYLAAIYLAGNGGIVIVPGLLGLRYVQNTGAAFSILSGKTEILIAVTSVALAALAYYIFAGKCENNAEKACLLLIFSGGIGNLIDRVAQGYVIDYFEFLFMDFAVFNMADVYVCLGVGLYARYVFYTEFYKKSRES